ncbi:MAG: hypothetical protein Q9166_002244 [cf. Caloplaca sp. 2 TL-2023]
MIPYTIILALAVTLCVAPFTLALPQISDATSVNPTVFTPWSSDPACAAPATACKADCTIAVDTLCRKDLTADNIIETVGECTAWYMYNIGNTIPTYDQCYSAFAYINDAGNPGADGCGGSFGGALGWDKNGNRTMDPAFAIYPKSGNGNCFKELGDTSPPLPQDTLPDGWLACLGGCDATGWKLMMNCEKDQRGEKLKARDVIPADPCANTMGAAFECPAIQQKLLGYHRCPGSSADPASLPNAAGGDGVILT